MAEDYFKPRQTFDAVTNWSAQGTQSPRRLSVNNGPASTAAYAGWRELQTGAVSPGVAADPVQLSREDVKDLGKSNIGEAFAPADPSTIIDFEEQAPKQMPGFVESFMGGMVEAFTGALPGFARDPLVGLAQGIGQIADIPLEAVGHVPINEWLGLENRYEAFELLPPTDEKRRTIQLMRTDPTNADWYLARYVRTHAGDYAAAKGLPQLLAPLIAPDATILERGMMLLGVPSMAIARHFGAGGRVEEMIETGGSHPEEQALVERYRRGDFGPVGSQEAKDRLADMLTTGGFAYTSDPFVSMLMEMVLDPVIVAGLATGGAMNVVRAGSLARRMSQISRVAQAAADAPNASPYVKSAVGNANQLLEAGKLEGGKVLGRDADSTYRFAREILNDDNLEMKSIVGEADEALRNNGIQGRADYYATRPGMMKAIESAAGVSRALNEPFRIFGKDGAAGLVQKRFSRNTAQGGVAAFGVEKVSKLYRGMPQSEGLNEALGYALSYSQRSMIAGGMVRQLRQNVKDAAGNLKNLDWMPDALPDTVISRLQQDGTPLDSQQFEAFMRRKKKQYVPNLADGLDVEGGVRKPSQRQAAYDSQMDKFRDDAAAKLAYASDGQISVSAARALLKGADDDVLAFVDWVHFGRVIKDLEAAAAKDVSILSRIAASAGRASDQRPGATKLREGAEAGLSDLDKARRSTLVGSEELTMDQARKALKDTENMTIDEKVAYYDELIGSKEVLYQNFYSSTRITKNADFVNGVEVFLKDAIHNESLVQTIKRENLPDNLRQLADDAEARGAPYEIGLAPAENKRWREVKDGRGQLVGYNPWMDVRVNPLDATTPTRFDVIRERIWQPIRAENMLQESRRKFIREGVRTYGLDRHAATTVFDKIRETSSSERTTMRGFTPDEFNRILDDLDLPDDMKARLGKRGLAELTARALEGDIRMVGATTKLTGKMKTYTGHYGNFMGVLAEKIYPLVRFNLNPVFLMQEWVEPYFFNILRGVKPGFKFGKEQTDFHNLLDDWNMASVLADGFEAREFAITGGYHGRQAMGPQTAIGKLTAKMPFGRVQEVKKVNYSNLTKREFGDNLHAAFEKDFPGQWQRIEAFFNELDTRAQGNGNLTRGDVAVHWFRNKGMYDPDTRHSAMHAFDGSVPDDLGRIDGIRKSHLAKTMGATDSADLRAKVSAKYPPTGFDEWTFRRTLVEAGMTPEYSARAYNVAKGIDTDDFLDGIADQFTDPAEAKLGRLQADAWTRMMAEIKGVTQEEYIATKFLHTPKIMGANGRLPYRAFTQLTAREMEVRGWAVRTADDPVVASVVARANQLSAPDPHKTTQAHRNADVRAREGEYTGVNYTEKENPTLAGQAKGRVPKKQVIEDIELNPVQDTSDFIRLNEANMDAADVVGAGEWYNDMPAMFVSFVDAMDDSVIHHMAESMDLLGFQKIDVTDIAQVREEVAARMVMGWGATQVQTSPRDGFGFLLRLVEESTFGERPSSVRGNLATFDAQKAQLDAMLVNFGDALNVEGLGAKLHDFIDSLLGNSERTFMRGEPQMFTRRDGTTHAMQPGAMDIWMGRDMGYVDSPMLGYIADRIMSRRNLPKDEAMRQAQLESGFFYMRKVKNDEGKNVNVSAEVYAKEKRQFEIDNDLKEGSMRDVWSGSPTEGEYEHMLRKYNTITDELNEQGYLGRGYDDALGREWTVADVQAIAWVRAQKALGIEAGGPTNMFGQNAADLSFEVQFGKNTPWRDAIPIHEATPDAQDIVASDVSMVIADLVIEETGVTILDWTPGYGATGDSVSANTNWRISGTKEQIEDAIDMVKYLTQEDGVMAVRPRRAGIGNKATDVSSDANSWGLDFQPSVEDGYTVNALRQFLDDGYDWPGSMTGQREQQTVVRTMFVKDERVPNGTNQDDFMAAAGLPDDVRAKLEDGTWVDDVDWTEMGGNVQKPDGPIPVQVVPDLYAVTGKGGVKSFASEYKVAKERVAGKPELRYSKKNKDPEKAGKLRRAGVEPEDAATVYPEVMGDHVLERLRKRGRDDLAGRLADRHLGSVQDVAGQSLKRTDPDAWAKGQGHRELLGYDGTGTGAYEQSSPRGWRGGTAWNRRRAAAERTAAGEIGPRRGRLYFKRGESDVTTVNHELFHIFADDLDPSANEALNKAWAQSTKKKAPTDNNFLSREVQEWAAVEFEAWSASGYSENGTMSGIFQAYAQMYDQSASGVARAADDAALKQSNPRSYARKERARAKTEKVFEGITPEVHRGPSATFNVDQFRMMEAARVALQRAEEEAFKTHYYKRGRTLLERSVNHPYLGLYPASYMWGKVLPELMRFLVKKPFGIDAPFAGLAMANHVYEAIQLELNTDDGTAKGFIEDFPEALRFMQLMVPGTPWDIPVNLPAWTRRTSQAVWQGKDPDIPAAIGDTAMYAFGPGRAPTDLYEFLQETQGAVGRAGAMLTGQYQKQKEEEERQEQLEAQGLWSQRDEVPESPRLQSPDGSLPEEYERYLQ